MVFWPPIRPFHLLGIEVGRQQKPPRRLVWASWPKLRAVLPEEEWARLVPVATRYLTVKHSLLLCLAHGFDWPSLAVPIPQLRSMPLTETCLFHVQPWLHRLSPSSIMSHQQPKSGQLLSVRRKMRSSKCTLLRPRRTSQAYCQLVRHLDFSQGRKRFLLRLHSCYIHLRL